MPKRCKYDRSLSPSEVNHNYQTEGNLCPSGTVLDEQNAPIVPSESEFLRSAEDKLEFLICTKTKLEDELDENMNVLAKVKQKIYALEAKVEKLIIAHVCEDSKHRMKKEIKFIKEEKQKVLEELRCIEDKITEKMLKLKKC